MGQRGRSPTEEVIGCSRPTAKALSVSPDAAAVAVNRRRRAPAVRKSGPARNVYSEALAHQPAGPSSPDPFLYAHARDDIVWMSQNTNHLPTSPAIGRAIQTALARKEHNKYPWIRNLPGLTEGFLADLGLPVDTFRALVTSGGTEALYIAMRAFLEKGQAVVTTDPSYLIIHHFIRIGGATPTDLPIYPRPAVLTADALQAAITPQTRMILLIDPLNPLGSGYGRDEVRAIAEIARDGNLLLFHDITYRDFADRHTLATEFAPERTLVAYSLSKSAGLAGLRVGGLVCHKDLMEKAAQFNTNDLGINILAQFAARAALLTKRQWMPRVRKQTRKNQAIIRKAVDAIDGLSLPVYPSQANMFVIDIGGTGLKPDDLQRELLYRHQVFVRSGTYVSKRFGDRFIRVSFSVPEAGAKRFAKALPLAVDALRKE